MNKKKIIIEFGFRMIRRMVKNYTDRLGGCYLSKPKAEADNTLLDLNNYFSFLLMFARDYYFFRDTAIIATWKLQGKL